MNANEELANRWTYAAMSHAIGIGLSDAQVAAANTVAGLVTAISGLNAPDDFKRQLTNALRYGKENGIITDAAINPLTTGAGLLALFTTADPSITTAAAGMMVDVNVPPGF
jgi:hypothetical protein